VATGQYVRIDGSGIFLGLTPDQTWLDASTADNWATWALNLTTNPFVEQGVYNLRVRAFDEVGNVSNVTGITFTYFTSTALVTQLNVSLSTSNISLGDSISMNIDLSVLANLQANLENHDVCLTITAPDATSQELLLHTDVVGTVNVIDVVNVVAGLGGSFAFDQTGTYGVHADFMGTVTAGAIPGSVAGLSCAPDQLGGSVVSLQTSSDGRGLLVGTSPGYAVIIEGLVNGDDAGRRSHNRTMNRVFEVFKSRGINIIDAATSQTNIYYYNFDTDQDGLITDEMPGSNMDGGPMNIDTGIYGMPTAANIQYLLTNPASPLVQQMQAVPGPLYIVMSDHLSSVVPDEGTFYIGADTISSTNLSDWITGLEGLVANVDPITTVIGACYSGSWLQDLSGPNRINFASATHLEESYRGPKEPVLATVDPSGFLRAGEFFVEEFFKAAEKGVSLKQAFEFATAQVELYTQIDSLGSGDPVFGDGAAQHPLVDDNNSHDTTAPGFLTVLAASNALEEPTSSSPNPDGQLAANQYLGVAPGFGFDPSTTGVVADVVTVTGPVTLSADPGEISAPLFLTANSDGLVQDAWVEIRRLAVPLPGGSGGSALPTFQVDNDAVSVRVQLIHQPGLGYTATPAVFGNAGIYRVFYYVQDVVTGNISPTRTSLVYKDSDSNLNTPTAPLLNLPAEGSTNIDFNILFDWSDSTDADGDAITYTLEVSSDPGFAAADIALTIDEIVQSYISIDSTASLLDKVPYYWRVTATDLFGSQTTSAVGSFLNEYKNALRPKANISVSNALSEVQLGGAVVIARQVVDAGGTLGATVAPVANGTLSDNQMYWQYQVGLYHMTIMPPPAMNLGAVTVSLVDLTFSDTDFGINFPDDSDGDGLGDELENGAVWDSAVGSFDSDGDGLVDGYDGFVSVSLYPEGVDVNGNGYVDGERDSAIQTDPGNPDSDGDGTPDGAEVEAQTDPNDPGSGGVSYIPGDIAPLYSPDQTLNAADYLVAVRYVLGQITPVDQDVLNRLDLNGNGGVDAGDLVLLQQLIQAAP
jgi:hypothetical protein